MIKQEIIALTRSEEYRRAEAEINQSECEECGYIEYYECLSDCPQCGSENSMIWTMGIADTVCDHCGDVFTDGMEDHYTYWGGVEAYEDAQESHAVCIDCYRALEHKEGTGWRTNTTTK